MLEQASGKPELLGITVATAEAYYSPYCNELQDRGGRLVRGICSPEVVTGETASKSNVVTLWGHALRHSAPLCETKANEDEPAVKVKP